jgi:F plasmid transfer operon, TraF, protein
MRSASSTSFPRFVASVLTSASSVAFVSSVLVFAAPVQAQTSDQVGVRALGMGGAFTAVADDSTATWWNPAGLASGSYFDAVLEYSHPDDRRGDGLRGISVAFPALGLSYYRLPLPRSSSATIGTDPGSRQDEGSLNVFGATVGQSFGRHLVIGSTVKIQHADDDTEMGLDIGAMAAFGPARLGLMVRNVTEPDFGSGLDAFTLRRQARAGGAITTTTSGVIASAALSVDADLLEVPTLTGDERRVAVGGEVWMRGRTLGIRGGASRSTIGAERTVLSGGASTAIRSRMFVDGYFTGGGTDELRDGWGLAFRVTF